MSIMTQIIRLQNAKSNIRSTIQDKGVSVPSSAKLDTYYTYIDSVGGRLINSTIGVKSSGAISVSISIPAGIKKICICASSCDPASHPPAPSISGSIITQSSSFSIIATQDYGNASTRTFKTGVISLNGNAGTITIQTTSGSVPNLLNIWVFENTTT